MRKLIFPVLLGLVGCAVLVSLGIWQVQRLGWKTDVLSGIEARISGPATDLPRQPNPEKDRFSPVQISGDMGANEIHVLTAVEGEGAGYRLIVPLDLGTRRVMVDLGYIPQEAKNTPRPRGRLTVRGNLHWPQEADRWTPEPDLGANIWFARDVPAMAQQLETESFLVIASHVTGPDLGILPQPVSTSGIPNDHLGYAITWFGLALVWAIMSLFLIRRTIRQE